MCVRLFLFGGEYQRAKGKYQEWLEPEKLILIEGWARDGLTDKQIAHNIGISEQTLNVWKKSYPSFSESLKRGKEVVDRLVENALLKKATGEVRTIRKPIKVKEVLYEDGKRISEKERIEYADEEIYIPPDTTAQIFWLKNRKPEEWRDKRVVDDSADNKAETLIQNMQTIADILQHPVSNRSIDDFEGVQDNE